MSAGAPWSVKGIDPKAREVAKDLARRSGMTLGEWLNRVILEDDLPEDLTSEDQFSDRPPKISQDPPRLAAFADTPDLARIAEALDRITDRIEESESRTGFAINGVEHSVRQTLARIETTEREQHAVATRLEGLLTEASAEQTRFAERLRRLESEAIGPRSPEVLQALEARLVPAEPETLVETVLERLADRLAMAEARTAAALSDLKGSLGALDRRLGSVERGGGQDLDSRFESLGEILSNRVEAVRAEVARKLEAVAGPEVETRLAAMSQTVRDAERRATSAVEEIGRQVLAMAEAVGRKLGDVDERSAEAIDQVGSEVARIASAVELRLARGEQAQAEAFERLGVELARVTEALGERLTPAEQSSPVDVEPSESPLTDLSEASDLDAAPPADGEPESEAEAETEMAEVLDPGLEFSAAAGLQDYAGDDRIEAELEVVEAEDVMASTPQLQPDLQTAALLEEARQRLGPPPESEPEREPGADLEIHSGPFGAELFSRAEIDEGPPPETIDAPWRRLDLDVPEGDIPEVFAPINESEDEDLFAPVEPRAAAPQLSTREVIDRARAAARAAADAKPVDMSAKVDRKSVSGRLFQGFGARPAPRRQNTTLQTALMVAGGAAFLSVGAAGLTLMQGAPPEPTQAELSPFGAAPRAAVAISRPDAAARAPAPMPDYAQVRAEVEAGKPDAVARLKTLAESGHPQAQIYLAQLYDLGEAGLPRDPVEARRLIALAAESGDAQAMHNLGVFYFRGEGGAQDLASAVQWFRKAAAAGVVESQYNLGLLYQSGSGVTQDLAQARYWFGQAAALGDLEARRALALLSPQSAAPRSTPNAATTPASARRAAPTGPLASQNVRQTQLVLARLGYYEGPADGLTNPAYRAALADYQRDLDGQRAGPRAFAAQR